MSERAPGMEPKRYGQSVWPRVDISYVGGRNLLTSRFRQRVENKPWLSVLGSAGATKPISPGVLRPPKLKTSVLDRSLNCEARQAVRRVGIGPHHSGPDPGLKLLGQLLTGLIRREGMKSILDARLENKQLHNSDTPLLAVFPRVLAYPPSRD
jgi:hypothetical protein